MSKVKAQPASLLDAFPAIAMEADGCDPSAVTAMSNQKRPWLCPRGHRYVTVVANRTRKPSCGCPYCSGRLAIPGETDLATTNPVLANQAHRWDPMTVKAASSQRREWMCDRGHVWAAVVASRSSGNGCPYCANKKVWPGENDLATTHPEVASQAYGWDPSTVMAGSHQQREWTCKLGHVWTASVVNRAIQGQGCAVCANKQIIVGVNDLATTDPDLASQADGWDPRTITRGSNHRRAWRCDRGHRWTANVSDRATGTECPVCTNRVVLRGTNDLATTHPDLAADAWGWDPSAVSRGSDKRKLWRCAEGHEWTTSVANRVGGKGCPSCATWGFDKARSAWLYLMIQPVWQLTQIGITNSPATRLRKHEKGGWRLVDLIGPSSGEEVYELEQRLLSELKGQSIWHDTTTSGGQFDGYTESWPTGRLGVTSFRELTDQLLGKGYSLPKPVDAPWGLGSIPLPYRAGHLP